MKKIIFILILIILAFIPINVSALSNSLKSLEVEGIGSLDLGRHVHNLKLTSSFGYVNITATPTDPSYKIIGDGQIPCEEGLNKIEITVTNQNNDSETYTLNLTYINKKNGSSSLDDTIIQDENPSNPNTGVFISTISLFSIFTIAIILKVFANKKIKFFKI